MKMLIFTAPWCGLCKTYHKIIEEFKKLHPEITYEDIDAENEEDVAIKYHVMTLPTTIVIHDDGSETFANGVLNLNQLELLIK